MKSVKFHPEAEADRIVIVAVMHLQRDPDCWKRRH